MLEPKRLCDIGGSGISFLRANVSELLSTELLLFVHCVVFLAELGIATLQRLNTTKFTDMWCRDEGP